MVSEHYKNQRSKREEFISKLNDGKLVETFIVDRGHKNGLEIHSLMDNGIVVISNYNTGKLITKLIASERQINRYYNNVGRKAPRWLIDIAHWNESLNYHYI